MSEFIRSEIFRKEKPKPESLKEILEKLEYNIAIISLCIKHLDDLIFDLEKYVAVKTIKGVEKLTELA